MKINYFKYDDIVLSDKYEKVFDKFEEKADIRVNSLKEQKDQMSTEMDTLKQMISEIRDIRLQYVGAKRKAIYGEDVSETAAELDFLFEGVDYLTKEAGENNRKFRSHALKTKRIDISKTLKNYKDVNEKDRNSILTENDDVQEILDDLYRDAQFQMKSLTRRSTSIDTKIEKKELAAAKEKWKYKSQLSQLEAFQEQAENMMTQFYNSFDIKV